MTFRSLECALAIAEAGSLNRAAEMLFISQPYLSGILKNLENELGFRIFTRKGSGVEPTELGAAFLLSAECIMNEQEKIKNLSAKSEEVLTIASYYSTFVMKSFLTFHNQSSFSKAMSLKEMGNREILDALAKGTASLGLMVYAYEMRSKYEQMIEEAGCVQKVLFEKMPVFACVSQNHALAGRDAVVTDDLCSFPYVSFDDESSQLYLTNVLHIGKNQKILKVSDRGSFRDALSSGDYMTVMPLPDYPKNFSYVLLPIKDMTLYLTMAAVKTKDKPWTPQEKTFISFLEKSDQ